MLIQLNGQPCDCPDGCTVAELLQRLDVPTAGAALARNDAVVRKAAYAETTLEPGDRIEIIRAVAGG